MSYGSCYPNLVNILNRSLRADEDLSTRAVVASNFCVAFGRKFYSSFGTDL